MHASQNNTIKAIIEISYHTQCDNTEIVLYHILYNSTVRDHKGLGFFGQKYQPKTSLTIPSRHLGSIGY